MFGFLVVWLAIFAVTVSAAGNDPCPEHFTCLALERNNEHLQNLKLNSSLPNWYELCNCDPYCHIFGDCCLDAPTVDKLDLNDWTFVRVRFSSKINFLSLMKSRCPAHYHDNGYVRQMCEFSPLNQIAEYLLPEVEQFTLTDPVDEFNNWHVTSRQTLVTYRNMYCSICNNDTETEAWNQRLMCQEHRCTAVYHQVAPEVLGKEKLKRTPLQNKVYAGCSLGWYKMNFHSNPEQVLVTLKKCLLFYAPVVVQDEKSKKFIIFKNKYCAQCNSYGETAIQCADAAVDQPTQVPNTFNTLATIDTNFRDGSVYDPREDQRCHAGEVYNPMIRACQEVYADLHQHWHKFASSGIGCSFTIFSVFMVSSSIIINIVCHVFNK